MNNISEITDLKRLYQLYIMTDKILNMQLSSSSGINYETLKRFKMISLRINYLHMQEFSLNKANLEYETKDIYEEQKKLTQLVKNMKDCLNARSLLISKYRKYSSLPLILEDGVGLDNLEYYSDKLDSINDYIKNETYISKIDSTMNELGLQLGEKTKEEEELLSMIPFSEKQLRNCILNDTDAINMLREHGFDIKELSDSERQLKEKYSSVLEAYNEISEKYEAIKYVDKNDYADVIREINNEYQNIKVKKLIVEIIKLILEVKDDYDYFYNKRINIKTNLVELGENIFGKKISLLIKEQMDMCNTINEVKARIEEIKNEIHKNNSMLSNVKRRQSKLKEMISKKKESVGEEELNKQVIESTKSYINYSKERVNNVLKYVLQELNSKKDSDNNKEEVIVTNSEHSREETDSIFEEVSTTSELFPKEEKTEEDDIFEQIPDSDKLFNENSDLKLYDLGNNIFNDRIDPEIYSPNVQFMNADGSFWPNAG